jgi:TrmH family RNA methyltransferase
MAQLRIVLVEPREAGNVGAAARVMKNFGFGELWIVGEHPALLPVSGWWASGADDLLAAARFAPSLLDAIGDAHLTVATTSSRGRTTPATFDPRSLGERFASLADDQILALVFGREDSGLTREELVLCQHSAVIPTNAAFPTMNLAQSICVFCYELTSIAPVRTERPLATAELVERMHERARSLLLDVGFLHENNPDRIYDDLRAIAARADLDEREATIVLGMIRQIEWALSNARGSDNRRGSR